MKILVNLLQTHKKGRFYTKNCRKPAEIRHFFKKIGQNRAVFTIFGFNNSIIPNIKAHRSRAHRTTKSASHCGTTSTRIYFLISFHDIKTNPRKIYKTNKKYTTNRHQYTASKISLKIYLCHTANSEQILIRHIFIHLRRHNTQRQEEFFSQMATNEIRPANHIGVILCNSYSGLCILNNQLPDSVKFMDLYYV